MLLPDTLPIGPRLITIPRVSNLFTKAIRSLAPVKGLD
jgi:hypothetical protein